MAKYVCETSDLYKRRGVWGFKYKAPDGSWKEKSTGTRSKREARDSRSEFVDKMQRDAMPTDLGKLRLSEVEKYWIEKHRANRISESTKSSERYRYQHFHRILGDKKLESITPLDLTRYQNERLAEKVSPSSINKELILWSLILKEANVWPQLRDRYKPLKNPASEVGQALTREQLKHLYSVAEQNEQWHLTLYAGVLAARTGLRGGEIKRIKIRQIDFENRLLRIRRHRSAVTHRREGVKTDAGVREVALNADALDALLWLHRRYRKLCEKAKLRPVVDHYLLPENLSRHQRGASKGLRGYDFTKHQKAWDTSWESLTKEARLEGFRFHDLRHTFITHMIEEGVPIERIMAQVGHLSAKMVRHYTHVASKRLLSDVAKLDEYRILSAPVEQLASDKDEMGAARIQ